MDKSRLSRVAGAASGSALNASNALTCAQSWLRPVDPEEDDRCPQEQLERCLREAEGHAQKLLEGISEVRRMAAVAN